MKMYRGDLKPDLVITLMDGDTPINLSTATSVSVVGVRDGASLFDRAATSATSAGVVTMAWQAADTNTAGAIEIEVEVVWPGGKTQTFRPRSMVTIEPLAADAAVEAAVPGALATLDAFIADLVPDLSSATGAALAATFAPASVADAAERIAVTALPRAAHATVSRERIGANYAPSVPVTWTDIEDSNWLEASTPARPGDFVEAMFSGRVLTGTSGVFLDAHVVSGTSNRSWTTGKTLDNTHAGAWIGLTAATHYGANFTRGLRVKAEDLSGGFLTLRVRWRSISGTATQTLYATDSGGHTYFRVTNLKTDRRVVLNPTLPWQDDCIQEPSLYQQSDGTWVLLYSAGWDLSYTGWATAPTPAGPWTDQGMCLGNGLGGQSGISWRNDVLYEGGTLYVYYAQSESTKVAVGTSPANLAAAPGFVITQPNGLVMAGNTSVVKHEGIYHMIFETRDTSLSPELWRMGYATATSPLGPFTVQTYPLPTLQPSRTPLGGGTAVPGMYGGPNLHRKNGTWVLWYQAGYQGGVLPTEIFRAESTDLVTWTRTPFPIIKRTDYYEYDQTADPFLVEHEGVTYAFWTGHNNVDGVARIYMSEPAVWDLSL